jgi:type VI protein secretion system component VasF|tara:strand:+ start:414 stop:680 length:267 start_codon:yes stop_codon:yes gene_type:complete
MSNNLLDFDFGFTAVDENELEAVQKVTTEASSASASLQEAEDKLNKLYNSILPLLTNLKKNPEKEYILWPNRVEKIEQFEDLITEIVK